MTRSSIAMCRFLTTVMVVQAAAPEPEPEEEGFSPWPFILLSVIVIFSISFDLLKEGVEEITPGVFQPLVAAFWSELATLGFIGALAFLMTYNWNADCDSAVEACSIMQKMSQHFLGEPMELQEIFERLHFLLFAVSVMFIVVVLLILRASLSKAEAWADWEHTINHSSDPAKIATPGSASITSPGKAVSNVWRSTKNLISGAPPQPTRSSAAPGTPPRHFELGGSTAKTRGPAPILHRDSVTAAIPSVEDLMGIYKPTQHHWFHRTWFEQWFLPQEELKCEYYRIRHRFIEDPDNYIETTLNKDFDFGHYLKLCLAHSCAHIIEVCPSDWFALWLSFSGVFISYYFFPEASLVIFFILEGLMVLCSCLVQSHLVCIRRDMVPSAARTPTLSHSPEVAPLLIPSEDGPDARAVPPPLLGPPPFLRSGRPQREEGFFVDKTTNTHEKLFVFGRRGPALLMHAVKLLLFGSVIMLAVLLVELAGDILAVGAWLMILAVLPPLFVIIEAPNSIQTLNMVTSIETMKHEPLLIEVVKHQKHEKHKKAVNVLSTLQFFLDQAEMLMDRGADTPAEGGQIEGRTSPVAKDRDVKKGFAALMQNRQTREMLDGLQDLFGSFDSDQSGCIDREELGGLLLAMGQRKSEPEVDRLFNLMDADGSGDVDFKEFATVIMADHSSKKRVNPEDLANRMWSLFDKDGDGSISPDEMIETFQRIGQNWDMTEIHQFLHNIDEDKSGTIEKREFVDFVHECFGHSKHGHGKH